jgi:hypothetical protein
MFILRHKTPERASLDLNRTKWSNRRKAPLRAAFSCADKGLCGSTGKAYKLAALPSVLLTGYERKLRFGAQPSAVPQSAVVFRDDDPWGEVISIGLVTHWFEEIQDLGYY